MPYPGYDQQGYLIGDHLRPRSSLDASSVFEGLLRSPIDRRGPQFGVPPSGSLQQLTPEERKPAWLRDVKPISAGLLAPSSPLEAMQGGAEIDPNALLDPQVIELLRYIVARRALLS